VAGVTVYDDFAHHPTAVGATLRALRDQKAPGRLVAVFEPRSYTSRTRAFQERYAEALAVADRVLVAAAHRPEKVPEGERISEAQLVESIRDRGAEADFVPAVDGIVTALGAFLEAGDRVAILSNGGFGDIHAKLLKTLDSPHESSEAPVA
jgi:UDP-N-acetylmuramate: L-alanyl-gamma-D-glutamyl-meso-diaminopimelate ligase